MPPQHGLRLLSNRRMYHICTQPQIILNKTKIQYNQHDDGERKSGKKWAREMWKNHKNVTHFDKILWIIYMQYETFSH